MMKKVKILLIFFAIVIACESIDSDSIMKKQKNVESIEDTTSFFFETTTLTHIEETVSTSLTENVSTKVAKGESPSKETVTPTFSTTIDSTTTHITEHPILNTTINLTECKIINHGHSIDDKNILAITWLINNETLCKDHTINIAVERKNCAQNCLFIASSLSANKMNHTFFKNPLIPCGKYNYTISIIGIFWSQLEYTEEFSVEISYTRVENLDTMIFEDPLVVGKLLTNITWDYNYTECDTIFNVSVDYYDSILEVPLQLKESTSNYTITLETLPACLNFTITVYPEKDDNLTVSKNISTGLVKPTIIRNFNLLEDENISRITVSWLHPEYGAYCIKKYILTVKNMYENETLTFDVSFPNHTYVLDNVYDCVDYNFKLSYQTSDDEVTDQNYEMLTTESINLRTEYSNNEDTTIFLFVTSIKSKLETTTSVAPSYSTLHSNNIDNRVEKNLTTKVRKFERPSQPNKVNSTETSLTLSTSQEIKTNKCSIDLYHFLCTNIDNENGANYTKESTDSTVTIDGLEAYSNYSCFARTKNNATDYSDFSYPNNVTTDEGNPSKPIVWIINDSITENKFTIAWAPPEYPKGIIKEYECHIEFVKYNYYNPNYCTSGGTNETKFIKCDENCETTFTSAHAYSKYFVRMKALNTNKESEYSQELEVNTKEIQSKPVRNFTITKNVINAKDMNYNKLTNISWMYPCQAYGRLNNFKLIFNGKGNDFNESIDYIDNQSEYYYETSRLEPDIVYTIQLYAETSFGRGEVISENYKLNSGIPVANISENAIPVILDVAANAIKLKVSKKIFESNVGKITEVALLIAQLDCGLNIKRQRNLLKFDTSKSITYRDVIDKDCMPQYHSGLIWNYDVVDDHEENVGSNTCEHSGLCNGFLKPGTHYALTFRLYTETGFSDTEYIEVVTNKDVPIIMISITMLSILCVVFLIGFYISWQRTKELRKTAIDSPYDRRDITVQNFPMYYKEMIAFENDKIKEEYKAINYFSENLDKNSIAAQANQKLNRYANISPYDFNRVVLKNDEFENDYINASYIDGYCVSKEYIAAQGPKPNTSFDFWRMVLQHSCETIVMLTSLVENNKLKCHEYFPKINGCITFEEIRVRCVNEERFPNYIKRILEVEKDESIMKVKHYYFRKWPDHGAPDNPIDLIDFIKTVRIEREQRNDPIIVHCSAGVGRTGTFIALDILMQRMKREKKINIYDLVKKLRSQRMRMVQTIEQYLFIYASAMELSSKTRPSRIFQNIATVFEEFMPIKKFRINFRARTEAESTL